MERVSRRELTLLFAGDELSSGCHSHRLASELCERCEPSSLEELLLMVYGDLHELAPMRARNVLDRAYRRWVRGLASAATM